MCWELKWKAENPGKSLISAIWAVNDNGDLKKPMVDRETASLSVNRWCQVNDTRQNGNRSNYVCMYENQIFMLPEKRESASENCFCVGSDNIDLGIYARAYLRKRRSSMGCKDFL